MNSLYLTCILKFENSLLSFTRFFSNKLIPIVYKKKVLQSFVNSKITTTILKHNSTMSTYSLSQDLSIPPIAGILFLGLKNLELCTKKSKKYKCGIKGQNYDSNKFANNKAIIMLSLKYPQFNLGFSWIIRFTLVSEDYNQSFEHWIFKCDALASFRWNSLNFINDLSCGSGESLVDTTLSILKILLLCFIILDLTGDHVTTHNTWVYILQKSCKIVGDTWVYILQKSCKIVNKSL
ncbi:hypothetical protein H8356DRAFT_1347789 [Neocallimastix lanati (nom. inval.)]|nr:hypothetical protein H8356DRAFT_1347789 [Neocallimastix sp. JGI-2020a]